MCGEHCDAVILHRMRTTMLLLLVLESSCVSASKCAEPAHRNELLCAVRNDVVDCTTENAKVLVDQFGGLVEQLLAKATGADGAIDWDSVLPAVEKFGVADGGCVLASAVQGLLGRSQAEAGPGRPSHQSVAQGFDMTRSKLFPGIRFRTARGLL